MTQMIEITNYLSHKVNNIATDGLATQGDKVLAGMILAWFSWNGTTSPPDGLIIMFHYNKSTLVSIVHCYSHIE